MRVTILNTAFYPSVTDCAVCVDRFAPGIAYSCQECSGGVARSAMGLMIALGLVGLVMVAQLFYYLGRVISESPNQGTDDVARDSVWERSSSSCSASLGSTLPLTAIKIVLTVWQIISQVWWFYRFHMGKFGLDTIRRGSRT